MIKLRTLLTDLTDRCSKEQLSVLLLGFSSGLPILLIGSTLQAWYTEAGVSLLTIGFLSLIGQPYVYKFLWAPLFDRFTPNRLGRRRSWIFLLQLVLAASLALLALLDPASRPWQMAMVALTVAIFSASQDIVIDAYRTDLLNIQQRGLGAAMATLGYRAAMLFAGALALIMADQLGWRITYLIMAAIMCLESLVTLIIAPNPSQEFTNVKTIREAIFAPLHEFFSRANAGWLLTLIVIYKLTDAFALSLNTPFLLRGIGFSLTDIGAITKTLGLVATLLGSVVGGVIYSRIGLYRSLLSFGLLQMSSNLGFSILALVGKNYLVMSSAIFIDYFCGGLSAVVLVALLTCLCDLRYSATQYALLSALAAAGRVFVGPAAAYLVNCLGWAWFYVATFVIGLPAILLLVWLKYQRHLFIDKFKINAS